MCVLNQSTESLCFLFIIYNDLYLYKFDVQEGVAVEIAEAVVGALKGELAATAVNAPMVPAEVETFRFVIFYLSHVSYFMIT